MRTLKSVIWRMNDYFFDIDPEEPSDYVGATIFYGYIILALIMAGVFTVASFLLR